MIGLGILMSMAQILLTLSMADGKLGVCVDDVDYLYVSDVDTSPKR